MIQKKYKGFTRLWNAFRNSWDGLRAVARNEAAFRQELIGCLLAAVILAFLGVSQLEYILLVFSLVLIPIAELINTAIENIVDRIGSEYHELSKVAKDIGSAIVLVTIVAVSCLWFCVIFF